MTQPTRREPPSVDPIAELHNPQDVENAIRDVANRIALSVRVCSDRYDEFKKASRDYDRAYAFAYRSHRGPAHEKRYVAEIATYEQREAMDNADVAYKYADRLAKALDNELRALQSVGASIRTMFENAGRGMP